MFDIILYLGFGLLCGVLGGLVGIGGGVAVVPILVLVGGMSQHDAQGTSLGMLLPPIGLLAVWKYYEAGQVNIKVAGLLALGFFVGGYFGARLATSLSGIQLRQVFGLFLLIVSIRMITTVPPAAAATSLSPPALTGVDTPVDGASG